MTDSSPQNIPLDALECLYVNVRAEYPFSVRDMELVKDALVSLEEQYETLLDAVQEYVTALSGFSVGNHDDPQWPEQALARLRDLVTGIQVQQKGQTHDIHAS